MYGKWEVIKRKGLGVKRGSKVLDAPHATWRQVKIKMTGQERGDMVSEETDVHVVGEHLRSGQCIAGRAGDLLFRPSASLELCKKDEEYLERNTRTKLRQPHLSSEDKMEKKKCTED